MQQFKPISIRNDVNIVWFTHVLPPGLTNQQVLDDLLIDGAIAGGGDCLKCCALGNMDDIPRKLRSDVFATVPAPGSLQFVPIGDSGGLLTYDPNW
ncbi:MAG: hypothetical protein R3C28_04165 [Pirellulaceae bacterium]